jgi:alkanesulfonate monooxygenase SsuD/methylene tetrahydromethanopterin reductase-like flavin-dependent oxidoreductase (luciferase family)
MEQGLALVGTAAEVAEQLDERLAHLGAHNVAIFPLCLGDTYDKYEDQVRRIADDVMPLVQKGR